MESGIERLRTLKVADVMTRVVTTVSAEQKMSEAAAVLVAHEISGAPVVDDAGKCVGMLSATDFLRHVAAAGDGHAEQQPLAPHAGLPPPEPWLRMAPFRQRVRANMSWGVQTIAADASLVAAARMMSTAHVHRLPVLDAEGRPLGMLTSLDLVCAMLHAVDEAEQNADITRT